MATTITINDTLRLDQTSGLQDDDTALDNALVGLNSTFSAALLALAGDLALSPGQLAYAASVKGAVSGASYITVNPDGADITDLFFSDPDGDPFAGNQVIYNGNPLQTVAGDNIYLWSQAGGDLVLATTSATLGAGDVVAAFYLDDTADNLSAAVQMVTFIAIDHPDTNSVDESVDWTDLLNVSATGSFTFDFGSLRSGSSLWVAVGSADAGVLVSGHSLDVDAAGKMTNASNTIHTSQGGDGATIGVDNQLFDNVGENAVFTLVTGFANLGGAGGAVGDYVVDPKPNDNKPEGIDYSGYLNVGGAGIFLSQSQGNDLKDLDIEVYEAGGGTAPEEGFNYIGTEPSGAFDDDTPIDVKTVTVVDNLGHVVGTWSISPGSGEFGSGDTDEGVTVTISDNNIDVNGLKGGYSVSWTVVDGETFNRFQVIAEGGQFDIGGVEVAQGLTVTEPVGDTLFVDDDGPAVDLVLDPAAALRLDETDNDADDNDVGGILATNSLGAAAYLTTNNANFGTDGEAGANPTVWSLSLTGANAAGVDSGLDDAVSNNNVMLFQTNSTTIVGRDGGPAGAVVMTITINATTGELTVVQNRAVEHNDPLDHDEAGTSSAMMNSGLVAAVRTITDGDDDSANDSVDVSQVIKLEDDGPAVELVLDGTAELRLDETDNDADDGAVGGILATNSLTAAAYLTTNTASFGSDGAAGANPTVWSLSLTGANAAGVDSGLDDAVSNNNVMLFVVNSTTIVGRDGGPAGAVVMTISINATTGELTVVQNRAVEHNDPLDHDEAGTSSAMMSNGLVAAVRTVTDGDGDSASDNVDVSQVIKLEDDGPDVDINLDPTAALRLDETDNDADDGAVGGILATNSLAAAVYLNVNTAAFGSDGAAGANPTVWSLGLTGADPAGVDSGLNDTLSGDDVLLFVVNSTTIVGKAGSAAGPVVMTITINATTGALTVVQDRAVEHDDPLDHDEAGTSSAMMNSGLVSAVRTITDGDGDTDSDSVDVSQVIKLEDDGPVVDLVLDGDAELVVDETTLPDSASIDAVDLFSTNTAAFGSDGPGADDTDYELLLGDPNSGLFDTLTGDEVILEINGDGTLITGAVNAGADVVFTIEIDPDTGEVTLTQSRSMINGDADDPDEEDTPLTLAADTVKVQRTITDGDGDSDSDDVDISSIFKFEDDGPALQPPTQDAIELATDDTDIIDTSDLSTDLIFPTAPDFGNDGANALTPILFDLRLEDPFPADGDDPDSGLIDTASGDAIRFITVGDDIVGFVDDNGDGVIGPGETLEAVRYSLAVDDIDSSTVTFTQSRAVFHALATPETVAPNTVFLDQTAIDGDGDVSDVEAFDLGAITFIADDEPTIGPIPDGLVDFELNDFVQNSLFGDVNNDPNATPYVLTAFTVNANAGGIALQGIAAADNKSVTYWADTSGNGTFGDAGDTAYYTMVLGNQGGPGNYTFTVLVEPAPVFTEFSFDLLPSGANLFGIVESEGSALLVMGKNPVFNAAGNYTNASDVIHTSQGGDGATIGVNNQMFDPGDGAYFTFINDPDPNFISGIAGGLTATEADDIDNVQYNEDGGDPTLETTTAFLGISQTQSNKPVSMTIEAFNIDGGPQEEAFAAELGEPDNHVDIVEVRVYNAVGTLLENSDGSVDSASITITIDAVTGIATVGGLLRGYTVQWDSETPHDQVLITGSTGKFDIGKFGFLELNEVPDQVLEFTAQVTDGDGDTASDSWKVGIDGTGDFDDNFVSGIVV